jgi:hypothetical protein
MSAKLEDLHKRIFDHVEEDSRGLAMRVVMAVRDEVEEYGAVTDPGFAGEVLEHAHRHVLAFVHAGRRGRAPAGEELDFVRDRGAQRARDLRPLDALLESYLIGQRTFWETIVGAAGDSPEGLRAAQQLTAFTFAYTHAINVAVAEAYLNESHALASEVERARRDLLDRLLSGRPPGPEEERRAEALGLRPGAVVVAEPSERVVMRVFGREGTFVVARHGELIGIAPIEPRELRAKLERAAAFLLRTHGVHLCAGVSSTCETLGELGRGYVEARRALTHAGAGGGGVRLLEDIPLFDYLAATADETAHLLLPPGMDKLSPLAETLRAYADCDLNVARAAELLNVHANTVHYRLRRVQELTGRDPRRFSELVELTTALRIMAS